MNRSLELHREESHMQKKKCFKYTPMENECFHVHTYRCKHAQLVLDEAYVEKALELGAKQIVFTDHAPFPENPFGNRMEYEDLDAYIKSMHALQKKYGAQINVIAGLEVEYLPGYLECYKNWSKSGEFGVLIIGQHFYEIAPGSYSFSLSKEELTEREYIECGHAIIEGIKSGLFQVVAHPDRIFRRRGEWTKEMETVAQEIIDAAVEHKVYLEKNTSSKRKNQYWDEFWQMAEKAKAQTVTGMDAHCVDELTR